ncbi:MAG TPA: tRNA pseudouridine(55) synthase TruB [Acidobacteriaceae bacterium]|nr:tRNA pseudouridine(55) synthase TruB [Acidobacteriaceae bacterium]
MNGLLILDKPGGMTSHDVVARVRRATGEPSVGHLGTLDPMATGVLPLLLGKYTRLAQFYGSSAKAYTGTIRFGFATDTYDAEGQAVGEARSVALDPEAVRGIAERFLGETEQMPPPYSAKKIEGKPAYKLAREGKTPELKPVRVTVDSFTIDGAQGDVATFAMRISAGGYVRAIAHAMGQALGCGAHLASLRRTQAGPFTLAEALPLNEMEELGAAGRLEERMPHPRKLLPEMPAVTADAATVGRIRNGMQVNLPEYSDAPLAKIFEGQRELIAVGRRVAGTLFQPFVVLVG